MGETHNQSVLTMNDALVLFCGCLQMRTTLMSSMRARMQTITMAHTSALTRASMARDRMTHSATTTTTGEREKLDKRNQATHKETEDIFNCASRTRN